MTEPLSPPWTRLERLLVALVVIATPLAVGLGYCTGAPFRAGPPPGAPRFITYDEPFARAGTGALHFSLLVDETDPWDRLRYELLEDPLAGYYELDPDDWVVSGKFHALRPGTYRVVVRPYHRALGAFSLFVR